jgi:hypothetical protein
MKTWLILLAAITVNAQEYRYCNVGGARAGGFNTLTALCDGFRDSNSFDDSTIINEITVEVFADDGSKRFVTLKVPELRAYDLAMLQTGNGENYKKKMEAALAAAKIEGSIGNIISVTVPATAKFFDGEKKFAEPLPKPKVTTAAVTIKTLGLEGQKMAAEVACLEGIQKLPSADIDIAFHKGEKSSSVAVISGVETENELRDLVVLPQGMFVNSFAKGLRGPLSRHYIEVPAIDKTKQPLAYAYSLTDTPPNQGRSNVAFFEKPYPDADPKPLPEFNLITNPLNPNHDILLDQILNATKEYRTNFDRDPRYKSETNLILLKNALNCCMAVPGMKERNNGEIDFFEEHIYRDFRKQFPKTAVRAPAVPKAGGPRAPRADQ